MIPYLLSLATAAILSLRSAPPPPRAEAIALDVATVIADEPDTLPWDARTTALAMVAAGYDESGLRPEVEDCRRAGDHGVSVGLWQVHAGRNWEGHARAEICADRRLQARLALHVLARCAARTPRISSAMHCYASGDAGRPSTSGWRKARLAETLLRRFPAEAPADAGPVVVRWR